MYLSLSLNKIYTTTCMCMSQSVIESVNQEWVTYKESKHKKTLCF